VRLFYGSELHVEMFFCASNGIEAHRIDIHSEVKRTFHPPYTEGSWKLLEVRVTPELWQRLYDSSCAGLGCSYNASGFYSFPARKALSAFSLRSCSASSMPYVDFTEQRELTDEQREQLLNSSMAITCSELVMRTLMRAGVAHHPDPSLCTPSDLLWLVEDQAKPASTAELQERLGVRFGGEGHSILVSTRLVE
jgi:hypothetical protein